ncbi:hypothetical protein BVY03_05950 [bacterium K02(2017)]|nr:hypothetical protein BVY03_05950 [bacterium K02(2017)]
MSSMLDKSLNSTTLYLKEFIKGLWRDRSSAKRINTFSQKQFLDTINNAYHNVPFYKKFWDDHQIDIKQIKSLKDINLLPILTKTLIKKHFIDHSILQTNFNPNQGVQMNTTGSTGTPLSVILNPKTYARYITTYIRYYIRLGYYPWDVVSYVKTESLNLPHIGPFFQLKYIDHFKDLATIFNEIKKNKTSILMIYPWTAMKLTQNYDETQLKALKLKFIVLNSEISTKQDRIYLAKVFNCPVYDEFSCNETFLIAMHCKNFNYHIPTDSIWLEAVDKKNQPVTKGQSGNLLITTLNSPAMPLIRYQLDDVIELSDEFCTCKSPYPIIKSFSGRVDDMFIMPDGREIPAISLMILMKKAVPESPKSIKTFKLIQLEPLLIKFQIVPGVNFKKEQLDGFELQLQEFCNAPIKLIIEEVKNIEYSTFKHKMIESHCTLKKNT